MLILTRRLGEALLIGDNVRVKVLSVRGTQVRLGIEAPRTIQVTRDEVLNPELKDERRDDRDAKGASGPTFIRRGRRPFWDE